MLYVTNKDAEKIELNWEELIEIIEKTTILDEEGNTSQPEHPFVDFKDPTNRIIALPAYVGGEIDTAGIKWIASFPDNINHGIPRANSVTILNSTKTGIPFAIFNTTLLSIVRTAAVTGTVLKRYFIHRNIKLNIGIIGFGPIGQMHYKMLCDNFGDYINEIKIYDIRKIDYEFNRNIKTQVVNNWNEVYQSSDIFLNATVTNERYVEGEPKKDALLINVSLRDYKVDIFNFVKKGIIVDNWEQVCRRNTDIERFHIEKNLNKQDVYTIADVIQNKVFGKIKTNCFMFNPFGMSTYDIAIGNYYYNKIIENNYGTLLSD